MKTSTASDRGSFWVGSVCSTRLFYHHVCMSPVCLCLVFQYVWCRREPWHFGLHSQEHFRLKTARSQTRASTSAWQSTAPGLATQLRLTFMFEVRSLLTPTDSFPLPFRSPPPAVTTSVVTYSALTLLMGKLAPWIQLQRKLNLLMPAQSLLSHCHFLRSLAPCVSCLRLLDGDLCILLHCPVVSCLDLPNLTTTEGMFWLIRGEREVGCGSVSLFWRGGA